MSVETSKMNAEEYKSFTEGQATGAYRQMIVDDYRRSRGDPPMEPPHKPYVSNSPEKYCRECGSEKGCEHMPTCSTWEKQFKPGQTVWRKNSCTNMKGEIIAIGTGFTACVRWPDGSIGVWDFHELTATDPEPQKCPMCGGDVDILGEKEQSVRPNESFIMVRCHMAASCGLEGPFRKSRLEAIKAWNSIRVENHK